MASSSDKQEIDFESMSIKQLRMFLTQSGMDCSAYLEKSELVQAAKEMQATDYDEEAKKIFAQLNLQPTTSQLYANLNAIWRHEQSGGTVYVGNYCAASNRQTLDEFNITAVVNCQGVETQNYFESDTSMTYFRFPIANLSHSMAGSWFGSSSKKNANKALNGLRPAFDFIEGQIAAGNSVLVHCLAGAHRAGTMGVAFLMYKTGMYAEDAIIAAKKCRPIISPFSTLMALLKYLEKDLEQERKQKGKAVEQK